MYCPNCRAESLNEELFCRYCGTELVEPSTSLVPVANFSAVLQN